MKKKSINLLIGILSAAISWPVLGNQYCRQAPYVIFHINGINTTVADAFRNRDKLIAALPSVLNGKEIKVHLAYNVTRGALSDLADSWVQKANELPGTTFAQFIASFVNLTNNIDLLQPAQQAMLAYMRSYISIAMANSAYVSLNDSDLNSIVEDIKSEAQGGKTVLLVPHSQGNLYANSAYARVTTGSNPLAVGSVGVMGVASPATYIAAGGDYVTSSNDLVIDGTRRLYPLTLPPNLWIKAFEADLMGHDFIGIYMNSDSQGRAQVVQKIMNKLMGLNAPTARASNRALKLEFVKSNAAQGAGSNGLAATSYPNASSLALIRPDGVRVDSPSVVLYGSSLSIKDFGAIACNAVAKNVVGRIEASSTDLLTGEYRLLGYSVPSKFHADMTVSANSSAATKTIRLTSSIPQDVELAKIVLTKKPNGDPAIALR